MANKTLSPGAVQSKGDGSGNGNGKHCEAKESLKKKILRRKASLLPCERAFLSALLVDEPSDLTEDSEPRREKLRRAGRVLDDDALFSLPFEDYEEEQRTPASPPARPPLAPPNTKRNTANHIGLWKTHEEGVAPTELLKRHSSLMVESNEEKKEEARDDVEVEAEDDDDDTPSLEDADTVLSDEEVRGIPKDEKDDASSASSWNMSEGGFDHYNAWEVLKDEYAEDFGFDLVAEGSVPAPMSDDPEERQPFKIIGTSSDDVAAQPHVLSPPLMESLRSFIPDSVVNDNWWLKFSLRRDGADLQILKRYVRAATHTVLAIETTDGDVFGCFTTSTWRSNPNYFGNGEAFLWRMRHNRMLPCHSLFEQAAMESEIDIFPYSGLNDYVQICTANKIAVGGGELNVSTYEKEGEEGPECVKLEEGSNHGFGLAINDDLLYGTSSPCATFRNPCLSNNLSLGDVFEIVNLEVWTFTPCDTLPLAEKMEMTKFFVQESVISSLSSTSKHYTSTGSTFSGADFSQEEFYRRYGENDDNEMERTRWEYQSMMDPMAPYGSGRYLR